MHPSQFLGSSIAPDFFRLPGKNKQFEAFARKESAATPIGTASGTGLLENSANVFLLEKQRRSAYGSFALDVSKTVRLHGAFYLTPALNVDSTTPDRFDFIYSGFGTLTHSEPRITAAAPATRSASLLEAILQNSIFLVIWSMRPCRDLPTYRVPYSTEECRGASGQGRGTAAIRRALDGAHQREDDRMALCRAV